jgi:hypothetical protein
LSKLNPGHLTEMAKSTQTPLEEKDTAFENFVTLCTERGLLQKPPGLTAADTNDGVMDDATLMCVIPDVRKRTVLMVLG